MIRLFKASESHFDFTHQDVWTLFHSYAFDFSVWEIWGALSKGGRLVIVPYSVARSSDDFYSLLEREQVTVLNQTPSSFARLVSEDNARQGRLSLRYVVFGGEALDPAGLAPWLARHGDDEPQLINMYGITETTVHVTYCRVQKEHIDIYHNGTLIGSPLNDLRVRVLSESGELAPLGVAGELYVGGAGVALSLIHI